ncbi:hypothetical protein [Calothrix sp. UHCC 0171]|uniref:hypothetical protein n=1 Tax=Calothrix sp. UHCC 0171 TaxID=3110245 RepID=UPI002B1F9AE9|nr:hypothetical protein [Calothrix sp. UHCC 0171]MEA5572798.1 hypothetical protein [Calothrix sp. UHCC 0171]
MVLAKRLLWVSGSLVTVMALFSLFVWYQLTRMPTSLQSQRSHSADSSQTVTPVLPQTPAQLREAENRVFTKITTTLAKFPSSRGEVTLTQNDIDILVRSQFVGDIVKDAITSIENGKLKISTIVDTQGIANDLGEGNRAEFAQALSKIPGLKDNSLYIEVEGKPIVSNNSRNLIALENQTNFKLGNLPISISQLSQYTGISEVYFQEKITSKGILLPIDIENVRVAGESLIIYGSGTAW